MLGRIPVYVIPIVAVVLVVGMSFGLNRYHLEPLNAQLAKKQQDYQGLQQKASSLDSTKKQLAETTRQWKESQAKLQDLITKRSIPLSFYMPVEAMITLAYELRSDLGPVLTKWLQSTGCKIDSTVSLPAPPGTPPSPPANGFYPIAQNLSMTVTGTLGQIRDLYTSLSKCPRVVTISDLSLSKGEGDQMTASFTLNLYLLVEAPAGAAAAPSGGGTGGMPGMPGASGMMPGMGGGPGMMGRGMGSGMMSRPPSSSGAAAGRGASAGSSAEEGGGSALGRKATDAASEEE